MINNPKFLKLENWEVFLGILFLFVILYDKTFVTLRCFAYLILYNVNTDYLASPHNNKQLCETRQQNF